MPSNCPHRMTHKCIDAQPSRRWLKYAAAPLGAAFGIGLMILGNETVRKIVMNQIARGPSDVSFWVTLSFGVTIFALIVWHSLKDEEATSWAYAAKGFSLPSVSYLFLEAVVRTPLS